MPAERALATHRGSVDLNPEAYPNTMVWENARALRQGECRFDVRFPGWTLDVVATNLRDAAEAAQNAVFDHLPTETVEVRCARSRHCNHPAEWIPIWQLV